MINKDLENVLAHLIERGEIRLANIVHAELEKLAMDDYDTRVEKMHGGPDATAMRKRAKELISLLSNVNDGELAEKMGVNPMFVPSVSEIISRLEDSATFLSKVSDRERLSSLIAEGEDILKTMRGENTELKQRAIRLQRATGKAAIGVGVAATGAAAGLAALIAAIVAMAAAGVAAATAAFAAIVYGLNKYSAAKRLRLLIDRIQTKYVLPGRRLSASDKKRLAMEIAGLPAAEQKKLVKIVNIARKKARLKIKR